MVTISDIDMYGRYNRCKGWSHIDKMVQKLKMFYFTGWKISSSFCLPNTRKEVIHFHVLTNETISMHFRYYLNIVRVYNLRIYERKPPGSKIQKIINLYIEKWNYWKRCYARKRCICRLWNKLIYTIMVKVCIWVKKYIISQK